MAEPSTFNVFNMHATRKIYKDFASQIERDRAYIAELERMLGEAGIEIAPEVQAKLDPPQQQKKLQVGRLMPDGSLTALQRSLQSIKEQYKTHEVSVQFRDLTFWNMVPQRVIPTVGTALKNFILGSGPKQRVDIIKNLTGRIMPKTMTLLMGPPGCGKIFFKLVCALFLSSIRLRSLNGTLLEVNVSLIGTPIATSYNRQDHSAQSPRRPASQEFRASRRRNSLQW